MLVANAVGLIVASIVLDGVAISVTGFIIAVVIFTLCMGLFTPFLQSQFRDCNAALVGGVALIATLVSLIVTVIVSNGLQVHGVGGWLGGTVIVWVASLIAAFLLPFFGLKKYLENRDDRR